tara:strand:- start:2 stop:421 length:420 start_codon:yes stop_codon:yes gene_type:complete
MTVLEASAELYGWFDNHDKFDLEEDISKLLKKPSKSDKAAVKCALDEFEHMEVLRSTEISGEKIWVLKKDFGAFNQEVKLSPKSCHSIAQLINAFREILGVEEEQCDPNSISSSDIDNLLLICYQLVNEKTQETDPSKN